MEMSFWRIMKKAAAFQAVRRKGIDALLAAQHERLKSLVAFARRNSPFYQRLYRHLPQDDFHLRDLPVTNKSLLMEHYDEVVTDRRLKREEVRAFAEEMSNVGKIYLGEFVVDNTSGTSGLRGYVAQHLTEWETFFALNSLRPCPLPRSRGSLWPLLRAPFSGIRVAVIAGTSVNFITPIAFLVMPRLLKKMSRVELISTLLPLEDMVERLNRFMPDRIHGYPTMLEALAYKQIEGLLNIRPIDISTSSEPLTPRARQALEKAFGVFVENTYGATEPWIMAKECPHGRMHLFVDGCIVEPVDPSGEPARPGEASAKIFVTNLHNFTQPFIRYEMDDSLVPLEGPCRCGSPLPAVEVRGRQDDPIYCRRPDGTWAVFQPMQFETLMLEVKGYTMFQIRQTSRTHIRITFVPRPDADTREVARAIETRFREHFRLHGLGESVTLEVTPVSEVERSAVSGKARQIASLVGIPEEIAH